MSALAEMERELIVERTLTGLAVARAKPTFDRSYSTAINDRAVARLKVTVPDDFGTTLPTMNVLAIKNKVRNSPPLSP